jgi:hypothetical protein
MTGLWTNDHRLLAGALLVWRPNQEYPADEEDRGWASDFAAYLIDMDVVRVLDPADTELIEQGARAIYSCTWRLADFDRAPRQVQDLYRAYSRAVVEVLRDTA